MTAETKKYLIRSLVAVVALAAIYLFFRWNDSRVYNNGYTQGRQEALAEYGITE